MHFQASILGKRTVAAGIGALIGLVTGMGSQVCEKSKHTFMNGAALHAFLLVLASEDLVVLLDTVLLAKVVHHEVGTVRYVPFELEHLFVELGAQDRCHLEVF